jgi:hypothetical protein
VASSSGGRVTAYTLEGRFRVKPAPSASGIIVLDAGQKLIVNANDDRAANPNDTLRREARFTRAERRGVQGGRL